MNEIFEIFKQCKGVTIDTRNITGGEMFFGLRGENVNGNSFSLKALDMGAKCCVVDDKDFVIDKRCVLVDDSLIAMQQLAKKYRSTFQFPVLAITGSNGKTTTKELITKVLSAKYKTYATKGNLNNHIGVPLTLLSIQADCTFAIIEMGANHVNEIASYCNYTNPDFALITNIGKAHLEGFGGLEGVLKGKSELFDYVKQKNGVLFCNSNQNLLIPSLKNYDKVIYYGYEKADYLSGKILEDSTFASVMIDDTIEINSHLVGKYNIDNILAAACIGKYFDVGYDNIKSAIENYYPENNRSELKEIDGNYFILDAYNANPSSMQVALENFEKMNAKNKVVILGDMREMGEYADKEHKNILEQLANYHFNTIVTVGEEFAKHKQENIIQLQNSTQAREWFLKQHFSGATILLKGSRGMQLERVVNGEW